MEGETLIPHVVNGHICDGSYLAPKQDAPIGPPIARPRKAGKNTAVQTFRERDEARRSKTIRYTALALAVQSTDIKGWKNPEVKVLEAARKFEAYLKGEEGER